MQARTLVMPVSPVVSDALVMRWPSKTAADVLDYVFDCSAWMSDAGETAGTVTVVVTPVPAVPGMTPPNLTVANQTFTAGILTLWLGGGSSGTDYQVQVQIVTQGGRTLSRALWLRCTALFAES